MRAGLVVNPYAGLGGPAGLKGSDAEDTRVIASERGVESRISDRITPVLEVLTNCTVFTAPGQLGESWCQNGNVNAEVIPMTLPESVATTAADTKQAVELLQTHDLDLLIFVGGDGTARDVLDVVASEQVVLGLPCGVKMHSAVFANNPTAAAEVVEQMRNKQLLTVSKAEVRDIDEAAFQQGTIKSRFYGEMWVPESLRYMQQVKSGGKEDEALVVEEIAAEVVEHFDPEITYLMGSGSTTAAVMRQLNLDNTLLGVDVVKGTEVLQPDAFEEQLFTIASASDCKIVVTVIGGQGHLFGRGNQQFSPRVIRSVGLENIIVVATKTKLESLPNGILVDTGDAKLDQELSGFIRVVTGYEDAVLCPVSA